MNTHDLTLLQRLWDWVEERGSGTVHLQLLKFRDEGVTRVAVRADRYDDDHQEYAKADKARGGWKSTLSDTMEAAARDAGLPTEVQAPVDNAERLAIEMNQVRSALGRVDVYRGMSGPTPIPLMVDELVRDHEEIEGRMDAILHLLVSTRDQKGVSQEVQDLIFEIGEIAAGRRDFVDARELTGEQ